jgi:hypothetical protein
MDQLNITEKSLYLASDYPKMIFTKELSIFIVLLFYLLIYSIVFLFAYVLRKITLFILLIFKYTESLLTYTL